MSNGPEPVAGSLVYASLGDCPDRYVWRRAEDGWHDEHGCTASWDDLVDPIDTLEPL